MVVIQVQFISMLTMSVLSIHPANSILLITYNIILAKTLMFAVIASGHHPDQMILVSLAASK